MKPTGRFTLQYSKENIQGLILQEVNKAVSPMKYKKVEVIFYTDPENGTLEGANVVVHFDDKSKSKEKVVNLHG